MTKAPRGFRGALFLCLVWGFKPKLETLAHRLEKKEPKKLKALHNDHRDLKKRAGRPSIGARFAVHTLRKHFLEERLQAMFEREERSAGKVS